MSVVLNNLTIAEVRQRYVDPAEPLSEEICSQMSSDPRLGVQRIWRQLRRRRRVQEREDFRMRRIQRFERVLWNRGLQAVAGVDEAGVGPLAGPVVAAAAVFPPGTKIAGVDDSKQLDGDTRQRLASEIRRTALCISIGTANIEEIDRLNIYHASILAMRRAVEGLSHPPQFVLSDARLIPDLKMPQRAICKGDSLSFSIAAASIIAKTHRDRLMQDLDRRIPVYGFGQHKGYGTPVHREAIRKHGPCPVHRKSFHIVSELNGDCGQRFYELLDEVEEAASIEGLEQLRRRLRTRSEKDELSPSELHRLRLLVARHSKNLRRQA
ncbi:MAG: ribonuclease HII [Acidobacteriota bacterium]